MRAISKLDHHSDFIFKRIVEELSIGIGIIQDNLVKYVNRGLGDMFGYTIDEIMNWSEKEFIKVVHPDYTEFILEEINSIDYMWRKTDYSQCPYLEQPWEIEAYHREVYLFKKFWKTTKEK